MGRLFLSRHKHTAIWIFLAGASPLSGVQTRISPAASIHIRREKDIPELRSGGKKLDRHKRAFLIELRWTHNVDFDLLLGLRIFEDELCPRFQPLTKNDHAAGGADGVCHSFYGFVLVFQVHQDGDA